MSVVDDFGLFDGRPSVIRAACYPLQLDKVGDPDVEKWILETEEAALVRKYAFNGKPYLWYLDFRQQVRAKRSKYPIPEGYDERVQVECYANDEHMHPETDPESETKTIPDGVGAEIPTLEQCQEFANDPTCGFPLSMVAEFYHKSCDRGWGKNWKARMRGAVSTYRAMEQERKQKGSYGTGTKTVGGAGTGGSRPSGRNVGTFNDPSDYAKRKPPAAP